MIVGHGIDILEIDKAKKIFERTPRIIERFLTDKEMQIYKKNNSLEFLVGRFSAKESVSKALGTGFRNIKFKDIEILKSENGKPFVKLYNKALERFNEIRGENIFISISHETKNVFTSVIIEKR